MRTYPTDSTQAVVRLLTMTLTTDGHYSMTEIRALDKLKVPEQLSLSARDMKRVIDERGAASGTATQSYGAVRKPVPVITSHSE